MQRRTVLTGLLATTLVTGLGLVAPPAVAGGPPEPAARATAPTYTNPVSSGFADTFADPAVIRGKDGYWYAYGTTDPLTEGEGTRHLLPISRSTDLVDWEYVGDAFTEATLPAWADTSRGAALWAPDIRYVDGEYRLYYVVTETTVTDEPNDHAIGVATAPTPTGPWTDAGAPVVEPRRGGAGEPGNFLWTFDPSHVVDEDGTEHLFYGSYYGGIWVTELSDDGLTAVGEPTQVAIDNKFEGSYVLQHEGFWYLFTSTANCCAGPTTGYSVQVGRSESLTGPYVDREGVALLQSRAGGTPVLAPNGNTWVGTGHNAVVADLAGQDWIVYHAIDREDPYLDGTDGINERPMLIDRLDWIDGWPTVNAGAWASEGEQVGPVTDAGVALARGGELTRSIVRDPLRVEADVRVADGASGPVGLVAASRPHGEQVRAVVDPATRELVVEAVTRHGRTTTVVASGRSPIPADVDLTQWTSLVLEVSDVRAYAELSYARLGDPFAVVDVALPEAVRTNGRAGALTDGAGADVANLSVHRAAQPVTELVAAPEPGALVWDDEFDGTALGAGWTTVRDPDVTLADGALRWPVESADLVGTGNDAGLLLRNAPGSDWIAETRLTIDLGTDTIRNFQQGGLIAYVDDDLFARLSHVAIWNTRQTEFGYETPYADRLQYGGTIVGPPSDTTWLRLARTTDASGEQEFQAFTSTDGVTWIAGGVWTFAADAEIRIGLVAHGNQGGEPATAEFDYLRVYRLVE